MPNIIMLPGAIITPIIFIVMLLMFEWEETEMMMMIAACIALTAIYLAAVFFAARIRTVVTYDAISIKGRLNMPIENIESILPDDSKSFRGSSIPAGTVNYVLPAFGELKGLRFKLRTGEIVFIGSKKPSEFENAVRLALKMVKKKEEE
ncbi:MAG: hypothetical protein FWD37_00920 [Methanomassiliicoccaceae archaeon]|nr:hypothetical protein [Methanomassiliicoccaceae archaeon]